MTERPPTPPKTCVERPRKAPWLSRKWWMALIGVIVAVVSHFAGIEISLEAVLLIAIPILGYIFGESWIDKSAVK